MHPGDVRAASSSPRCAIACWQARAERRELRQATVLFVDMVRFSRNGEHTPPHDVVATLNELFTEMTAWCGLRRLRPTSLSAMGCGGLRLPQ